MSFPRKRESIFIIHHSAFIIRYYPAINPYVIPLMVAMIMTSEQ